MKIYILQKSLTDLKKPIIKKDYETFANTIKEFISEMVSKNYTTSIRNSLDECISLALTEFTDGSYYIINQSKGIKYTNLNDEMDISPEDEIVLIKLKYIRGIVW